MSLLDDIPKGAVVGLDTAPLIYFVEAHPRYGPIVRAFFLDRIRTSENSAITSMVSLAEVIVQPLAAARTDLVERYRELLTAGPHLMLVDITANIAERSAILRSRYAKLRLPDAFQLAAALEKSATHFLTNDLGLRRVTDLKVLILDDYLDPTAA